MKIHSLNAITPVAYKSTNFSTRQISKLSTDGTKITANNQEKMKPEEINYLRYGGSLKEMLNANPTAEFLKALEEVASPFEMMMYGLGAYKYIQSNHLKR